MVLNAHIITHTSTLTSITNSTIKHNTSQQKTSHSIITHHYTSNFFLHIHTKL